MSEKINNRTIAFLDILAFKTIQENFPLERVGNIYGEAIEHAKQYFAECCPVGHGLATCKVHIFSDSIIIYSSDDSFDNGYAVIRMAQKILQMLIVRQLPVRGAITFGEVYIDEERGIRVGEPFTKAYILEQQQEWIGVLVSKSVVEEFPELFRNNNASEVIKYFVPLKCGHCEEAYVLNWRDRFSDKILDSLSLFPKIYGDKIQIKYNNTIDFVNAISLEKAV